LSLEPLLGSLPSLDLSGIDWVIAGGESGPRARAADPDWFRYIRDRCVSENVAFHFKQWGEWAPGAEVLSALNTDEVFVGLPLEHGLRTTMRRVGKKAAGRELDGRTWDEFPRPFERHRDSA
jgi:protein gp37